MTDAVKEELRAVSTTATRVKFFEDRAEVTRKAMIQLNGGRQWVRLGGITPLVDERSVQANVASDSVRVISARVVRRVRPKEEMPTGEAELLNKELRELDRRDEIVQADLERDDSQREYITELLETWAGGLAKIPREDAEAPIADWEAAYDDLAAKDSEALAAWLKNNDLSKQISRQRQLCYNKQSEVASQPSVFEAFVEVQLDARSADELEIEITYRTPCAIWRPEHLARLNVNSKNPGQGTIQLTTWAATWQRTGEDWKDVEVSFSTARPAAAASAPALNDDRLSRRKKSPEEKKKIVVEIREQTVSEVTESTGAAEMPGVDDGGVPLEFTPAGRFNLPSNGQPLRVEVGTIELSCEVSRELLPERAAVAHLKATGVLPGAVPLLAGPVRVARGASLVGRSRVDFVGPGEKLEFGFGPDDGIRCRRNVNEGREKGLTGTTTIERKVDLYLTNLSDEARPVTVVERVPVSEIEGLEVKLLESKGWDFEARDGFLTRTVEVAPRATKELTFKYRIRAKSNVTLPF